MPKIDADEPVVQLATRIPKHVHREVKLHVVRAGGTIQEFLVGALRDKLERDQRKRARG